MLGSTVAIIGLIIGIFQIDDHIKNIAKDEINQSLREDKTGIITQITKKYIDSKEFIDIVAGRVNGNVSVELEEIKRRLKVLEEHRNQGQNVKAIQPHKNNKQRLNNVVIVNAQPNASSVNGASITELLSALNSSSWRYRLDAVDELNRVLKGDLQEDTRKKIIAELRNRRTVENNTYVIDALTKVLESYINIRNR
jgi:hypothetical protein